MYLWRKLTEAQRAELLTWRQQNRRPWHRPPHRGLEVPRAYHLTAACYEHAPHIGYSCRRMEDTCDALLENLHAFDSRVHAWCLLPNHYHALITTDRLPDIMDALGQMHGRLSRAWNLEEKTPGRQNWCGAVDRVMRSENHYWATMNYIHHNPVRHRYVTRWQDWPYGSAVEFLERMERAEVEAIWRDYPVLDYGAGWDDPDL
jgi:putative transposase